MNLASGPKIPSWLYAKKWPSPIFVLYSLVLCVQLKKLAWPAAFVHKEHTHPRHIEIIRASAAHWKALQGICTVHCTLKMELSYFDRYLDVLVPKVGDVHRGRQSVCPSPTVNTDRPMKDKRIAVSAIFVICSRWQQCHHGMNAITETISLFISLTYLLIHLHQGESLWLWRTVSCILWTSKGFWFRGVSESSSQFLLSSQLSPCWQRSQIKRPEIRFSC